MLRGIYSSATGMITQYKKIDVLGNNISNVNTDGFKRDELTLKSFDEEITDRMTDGVPIGSMTGGDAVNAVSTDFTQGDPEQTGRDTDLCVMGDGFFAVEDGQGGVKYTRDGNFNVDQNGYLELSSGERLLDENNQPLHVGGDSFAVSSDGTVTAGGSTLGKIGLTASAAADGVRKRSDGFFDITSPTAAGGHILQGYVEDSNVAAVDEMTGLMAATRSFQASQQAFQVNDDTLDKLINQVGSIKA